MTNSWPDSCRAEYRNKLLRMKSALLFLTAVLMMSTIAQVLAAPREYLFRDKRVCDEEQVLCFRGTMSYEPNPRLVRLRARVRTAPGPGLLRIRLAGTNDLGHRRISPFEVRVRGQLGEIISHRMIPDYPDVMNWHVELVEFLADDRSGGS